MKKSISFILICSLLLSTMQPLMAQKEEIEEQQAEPEVSVIELQKAKPLAVLSWFRSLRKPTWQDVQKGQDYVNSKYRCLRYGEGCSKKERAVLVALSALVAAAVTIWGGKKLVKEIKEEMRKEDEREKEKEQKQKSLKEESRLIWHYVREGDLAEIQNAIRLGINVNKSDTLRRTLLMIATNKGHTEIVRELLNAEAKVNEQDSWYRMTALMIAANSGHAEIVKMLLDEGADWTIKNYQGKTVLEIAIDNNLKDIIKELIKGGADYKTYLEVPIVQEALGELRLLGTPHRLRMREIGGKRKRHEWKK